MPPQDSNQPSQSPQPPQPPQFQQPNQAPHAAPNQPTQAYHMKQQNRGAYPVQPDPSQPEFALDTTPNQHQIDAETERRHHESEISHPHLSLSPGEYVITGIHRHPIGLFAIWGVVALVTILTFAVLPIYALNRGVIAQALLINESMLPSAALLSLPMLLITILFAAGGLIATIVYMGNKFYITNESVVQFIQTSLFSTKEQTINLKNIEDASYRQHGILQHLLNYGSLRLSTEGDETTYRFSYVANPRKQTRLLVDAIEHAVGISARFRKRPPNTNV